VRSGQSSASATPPRIPIPIPASGTPYQYRVFAIVAADRGGVENNQPRDVISAASAIAPATIAFTVAFTAPPGTLTTDVAGLEGHCVVQRLSQTLLTAGGTHQVRILLRGSTTGDLTLDKVTISQAADSQPGATGTEDLYDAAPDLTEVGLPGLLGVPIPIRQNAAVTVGPVDYVLDPNKDLLVAFDISNTSGQGNGRKGGLTGGDTFDKPGIAEAGVPDRTTGYPGVVPDNLSFENAIKAARDDALSGGVNDAVNQVFAGARQKLIGGLKVFDESASATFTAVKITEDGLIVRGEIGSGPRQAPVVQFVEIDEGRAFSALTTWIPGGKIDRYIWSWVGHSAKEQAKLFSGSHKRSIETHRFIFPKPAGMDALGSVSLRIEGTQTGADGLSVPIAAESPPQLRDAFGTIVESPAWWEPIMTPVWLEETKPDAKLKDLIAGHVPLRMNRSNPWRAPWPRCGAARSRSSSSWCCRKTRSTAAAATSKSGCAPCPAGSRGA
jgi:hypothetical protein